MASIILYSTLKPARAGLSHGDYQAVGVGKTTVFIRCERHRGSLLTALDAAKPRDGETVLNTIPATA